MIRRTPLSPGCFAGPYRILRLLSDSGGSALVYYACRDDENQRLYVLKELYPDSWSYYIERNADGCIHLKHNDSGQWARLIARFQEEAENYARLQQRFASGILPGSNAQTESAYTFFCEKPVLANGTCYLPIATSSGETLSAYYLKLTDVRRRTGQLLPDVIALCAELCSAVHRLHEERALHLDLKPDNLFITDGRLKLLDFGSMADIDNPAPPNAFTPGFSAPELIPADFQEVSQQHPCVQSDVFSICAILYWMLFGMPRSENKIHYGWELSLPYLNERNFPPLLTGCSLRTIEDCLSILRRGMSLAPGDRHKSVAALRSELVDLRERLEIELRDSGQSISPAAFVDRVRNVYAFRRALVRRNESCADCDGSGCSAGRRPLTCRLMNRYIDLHITPQIGSIVNETAPKDCLAAIDQKLTRNNQYSEALFALLFVRRRAELSRWHSDPQHALYADIAHCAALLGRDDLKDEYTHLARQFQNAETPLGIAEFGPGEDCESAFDFGGMVEFSRSVILRHWGGSNCDDRRKAVRDTILNQDPVSKLLIQHAGRYIEGLCLARCEGWKEDSAAILNHLLVSRQNLDGGFRARTVDNMLHFAIETGDSGLFLKTLPLIPDDPGLPESLLRPCGGLLKWNGRREPAAHVEEWLVRTAEEFALAAADRFEPCQYVLYLFLQSVNVLFARYLKKPDAAMAMEELCTAVCAALKDGMVKHPQQLILKHAALAAHSIGLSKLAGELRRLLNASFLASRNGLVKVITGGALLAVDKALGINENTFGKLSETIRNGIRDGRFREELFRDALDDPRALADCFRFRHT